MKKEFDGHIMLKQQLDDNTLKLYYFRINNDIQNYECEEYIYKDKQVLDLKYGQSSEEYFDNIFSQPNVAVAHPSIYFGYKAMGFKAFDEDWINNSSIKSKN